jgi:hypothetical protein
MNGKWIHGESGSARIDRNHPSHPIDTCTDISGSDFSTVIQEVDDEGRF